MWELVAASGAGWSPELGRVIPKPDVGSYTPGQAPPSCPISFLQWGKETGVMGLNWGNLGSQESPGCPDAAEGCIDINTHLYKYIQKLGLVILVGLFRVRAFCDSIKFYLYAQKERKTYIYIQLYIF